MAQPTTRVYELHIDTSATTDIVINPGCFPLNASPGDLIAVRPHLEPGSKGKAKDSPLLYKIESPSSATATDEDTEGGGGGIGTSSGVHRRRTASAVTVSPTLAAAFGWVQNRMRVQLTLVSLLLLFHFHSRYSQNLQFSLKDLVSTSSGSVRISRRTLLQQPLPLETRLVHALTRSNRQSPSLESTYSTPWIRCKTPSRRYVVFDSTTTKKTRIHRSRTSAVDFAQPRFELYHRFDEINLSFRIFSQLHLCRSVARNVAIRRRRR